MARRLRQRAFGTAIGIDGWLTKPNRWLDLLSWLPIPPSR